MFPGKEATATQARAVDPALVDEILEVASATNYGQETTPEQVRPGGSPPAPPPPPPLAAPAAPRPPPPTPATRPLPQTARLEELFEAIRAGNPRATMTDGNLWGEWRLLWASDNKFRGPFGNGPIANFYKVKDLTQALRAPATLVNENFLTHVGFLPATTYLEGKVTVQGPKTYTVEFSPSRLTVGPAEVEGGTPPVIFGEISYVDERLRLLRGRRADAGDDVPFTCFVFERIADDSKGLPASQR